MTNKPMLSVERDLVVSILENAKQGYFSKDHGDALRALLKNTACIKCNDTGEADSGGVQSWGEDWCEICGWVHRVEGESCDSATERERKWSPRKQIAPVADHPQCEECKGWGYHENHHEGGGTECGECGGSGNATVAVALDTSALLGLLVSEISVDDRGFYHLSGIHPNNFKRALEASGAKLTSEVKSHKSPVAVEAEILERFPEINFANYGQDEVEALQAWAFEAYEAIAILNGVTK